MKRIHSLLLWFLRPRFFWAAVLAGFLIGGLHALSMLPIPLILGTGRFWEYPAGTVPGSISDMAQVLVANLYFTQGAWTWPLLMVPELMPPRGVNIFWMDAVPLVALIGKVLFAVSGHYTNLLGFYLFACLALPGAAMAALLWLAGQRSFIAAFTGAALVSAAPFLIVEWGHMALSAQVIIIFALCGYQLSLQRPDDRRVVMGWAIFLPLALLTNMYLFVMAGGIWSAAVLQRLINRRISPTRAMTEAVSTIGIALIVVWSTGILGSEVRSAASGGFGQFSMNLASPFVPQRSGVIPFLWDYYLGARTQVYNYVGLGALILGIACVPVIVPWLRRRARAHAALIAVFIGFVMFALSHRITLGGRLLFTFPLPENIVLILGSFRASGRFFWPLAYAGMAVSIVTILRSWRPIPSACMLLAAAVLQIIDLQPMRQVSAESASRPYPELIDRARLAKIVGNATEVAILPRAECLQARPEYSEPAAARRIGQASMDIELAAARKLRPINSAFTARSMLDCGQENTLLGQTLRPGVAYFFLEGTTPAPEQLGGQAVDAVCQEIQFVRACLLPQRQGN